MMKTIAYRYIQILSKPLMMVMLLFCGAVSCNSCSEFTEVELPNSQLAGDAVYGLHALYRELGDVP